ncbi:FUSC family protein [Agrobacterium pusense]|uniref:FUSC family protein n=1 Tax=Agrobacterium pusense TaxID=648995 RepID=UPI000D1A886C|nr:FUSC family protein [Agrobacterium pusense]
MTSAITERDIAFVLRCSAAATLSYALASSCGLVHPVWASISGIIVSQDTLDQTKSAVLWRFVGTLVRIVVAVAVN